MIENILLDYIVFIKTFEDLIRSEYQLSHDQRITSGINFYFQRESEIDNYKYRFHGAGCRLEKGDIICEYNYYINDITFTLWAIKQFIITNSKYQNESLSDKCLELELYKFIESGHLSWKIEDGVAWEIYQFNK
ncbi:DUF6896 domain-containing protein [Chryseobacterium limigenitum]|uniref:DUF6896 domain-containing protein n=1 Tax=Chryseobacterium limigenitum TaxID=1612149 RepID=A0A1K2IHF7_9FLAO|nr:hypothetical protein [Chryseobacterium limigenitum]SFZ91099.1 hypothetical protein SAMN05216324_10276 [Chryseobacterium limigenitum]